MESSRKQIAESLRKQRHNHEITDDVIKKLVHEATFDNWVTLKCEIVFKKELSLISLQANYITNKYRATQSNPEWIGEEWPDIKLAALDYLQCLYGGQ